MSSSLRPSIAMLGMGKMGSAMAQRLREHGHGISIWSRSRCKAEAVKALALPGRCVHAQTAISALELAASDATVILVLSDAAACLDMISTTSSHLHGKTVLNLTSGSPDDARRVAAAVEPHGIRAYIDGAYCGPPAKVREGAGVVFLSSEARTEVERLTPMLSALGEVAFAGGLGKSRALDIAVVDLALSCYTSLMANMDMLEREGVCHAQLHEHIAKRLAAVPDAIEEMHEHTTAGDDASG